MLFKEASAQKHSMTRQNPANLSDCSESFGHPSSPPALPNESQNDDGLGPRFGRRTRSGALQLQVFFILFQRRVRR